MADPIDHDSHSLFHRPPTSEKNDDQWTLYHTSSLCNGHVATNKARIFPRQPQLPSRTHTIMALN
jgi:hypothetical protein